MRATVIIFVAMALLVQGTLAAIPNGCIIGEPVTPEPGSVCGGCMVPGGPPCPLMDKKFAGCKCQPASGKKNNQSVPARSLAVIDQVQLTAPVCIVYLPPVLVYSLRVTEAAEPVPLSSHHDLRPLLCVWLT